MNTEITTASQLKENVIRMSGCLIETDAMYCFWITLQCPKSLFLQNGQMHNSKDTVFIIFYKSLFILLRARTSVAVHQCGTIKNQKNQASLHQLRIWPQMRTSISKCTYIHLKTMCLLSLLLLQFITSKLAILFSFRPDAALVVIIHIHQDLQDEAKSPLSIGFYVINHATVS